MERRYADCEHCNAKVDRYSPYSVSEGLYWFCNRNCYRWWKTEHKVACPLLCYLSLSLIALGFAAKYFFG